MFRTVATATLLTLALNLVQAQSQNEIDPYAPIYVECPRNLTVRAASQGLSASEKSWREQRGHQVISSLESYLKSANISGLNVNSYLAKLNVSNMPVVGMSISGGGTQSGVGGLGVWEAFDNRSSAANQARTGGIVQILTYLSGLSGGGALTVSTMQVLISSASSSADFPSAANNFTTVDNIKKAVNFSVDYVVGPTGNQTEYFTNIFENVGAKAEAGFPISVTDAFGQFWGNYLPAEGMYSTFSGIASPGNPLMSGKAPMPIVTLAEVIPGRSPEIGNILYPGNNGTNNFNLTSYEVTPFEFGSWLGGRVQAFIATEWLGTSMSNGTAQNSSQCAQGFDQFVFIQGSTANAFDAWFIDAWYGIPVFAKRMLEERQAPAGNITIPADQADSPLVQLVNSTATYFMQSFNESMWATYPNPFQDYNPEMRGVDELLLVDGSLTGETNPIRPLIVPQRGTDLVIVYEASSDAEYSWVNGTNLINSGLAASQGHIPFPKIPDVKTMVTQNLTKQPTFFGCNDSTSTPLVLYLPNSPWSGYSNFSYTKSSFTDRQFNLTVENAFNLATYGNGTVDAEWPECLACAVIWKSLARVGIEAPQQCTQCFVKHCWDGKSSSASITPAELDPRPRLNPGLTYAEYNKTWNMS